jgi:hypothetical protein
VSKALESLRDVDFDWVRSLDSIWSDQDATTGGPNQDLVDSVVAQFLQETLSAIAKPRGGGLIGQSGIGKTHLVGLLRRQVWRSGGWFVLLDVLGLTDFWRSAALRTSVTTIESDGALAPCGDLTQGGGIPGMSLRQYAGRHDRHASDSAKMGVRRLETR